MDGGRKMTSLFLCAMMLAAPEAPPLMYWGDESRYGHPFAKDPSVIRFEDRYLLYHSVPPWRDGRENDGWRIGIAQSTDLTEWKKIGELEPVQPCEKKGLCAPDANVFDGKIHLFYQTYGNRKNDAICHAVSEDGITFSRNPENPIFQPAGDWTVGRAIDAEVFEHDGRMLLYYATRDPEMKIQMVGVAAAEKDAGFGRNAWKQIGDGPILKPELPWEQECIEGSTLCRRGDWLYMFYAGAYNNKPQQIGVARSRDGIHWKRLSEEPFLPKGKPGTWNSSESGHPCVFVDENGDTHLFFQGNNDHGKSWYLSRVRVGWTDDGPVLMK
jgi:beta-xylosidase